MFQLTDDYLAAFIDAEGWFTLSQTKSAFTVMIGIANINLEILELIQKKYGGKIYKIKSRKRQCYNLKFSGYNAIKLAELLKDKLFIKRQQADIFSQLYYQDDNCNLPPIVKECRKGAINIIYHQLLKNVEKVPLIY